MEPVSIRLADLVYALTRLAQVLALIFLLSCISGICRLHSVNQSRHTLDSFHIQSDKQVLVSRFDVPIAPPGFITSCMHATRCRISRIRIHMPTGARKLTFAFLRFALKISQICIARLEVSTVIIARQNSKRALEVYIISRVLIERWLRRCNFIPICTTEAKSYGEK